MSVAQLLLPVSQRLQCEDVGLLDSEALILSEDGLQDLGLALPGFLVGVLHLDDLERNCKRIAILLSHRRKDAEFLFSRLELGRVLRHGRRWVHERRENFADGRKRERILLFGCLLVAAHIYL